MTISMSMETKIVMMIVMAIAALMLVKTSIATAAVIAKEMTIVKVNEILMPTITTTIAIIIEKKIIRVELITLIVMSTVAVKVATIAITMTIDIERAIENNYDNSIPV